MYVNFIKHYGYIQVLKDILGNLFSTVVSTNLLIGGKGQVERAQGLKGMCLEVADGLQVLHPDSLECRSCEFMFNVSFFTKYIKLLQDALLSVVRS